MAIYEAMYAGLFAGQIDVIDATVDDMLPNFDPEQPYVCVFALTELLGADGIVASNEIRSIADLKGKTVAFAERTVSQFYLNVLLRDAGLSQADIEFVNMSGDDAGDAFLMQEVDAAVSWEPWLTQGKEAKHGHLLADTSERPGLVVECLVTKTDVLDDRLAEFRALARAWDAALDYVEAHPDEANRDHGAPRRRLARGPRGLRRDPEGRPVLRFREKPGILRHSGKPGQIYQTAQYGIDIWSSLGTLDVPLTPADVIRHDLWVE